MFVPLFHPNTPSNLLNFNSRISILHNLDSLLKFPLPICSPPLYLEEFILQGTPVGAPHFHNPYYQSTTFPPAYHTQTTHISPSLYNQIPYISTHLPYPNIHVTSQYPNLHTIQRTILPNIPFTKYTKVEFLKFNGEDLRTWIYKVEKFFANEEVTIQQRMKLVSLHFEGDVLQ